MACISSAVSTSMEIDLIQKGLRQHAFRCHPMMKLRHMEIDLIFKGIKTVQDCTVHLPQARTVEIDLI